MEEIIQCHSRISQFARKNLSSILNGLLDEKSYQAGISDTGRWPGGMHMWILIAASFAICKQIFNLVQAGGGLWKGEDNMGRSERCWWGYREVWLERDLQ